MLKNDLTFYENLLRFELQEKEQERTQPERIYYYRVIDGVNVQRRRILLMLQEPVSEHDDQKYARFIRNYQDRLVSLIELASDRMKKDDLLYCEEIPPEDCTWPNLYRFIYASLVEILSFIERDLTEYFDTYARAPILYVVHAQDHISRSIPILLEIFNQKGICETLLLQVMAPFSDFISKDTATVFTYQRLYFLRTLSRELVEAGFLASGDLTDLVQRKLMELNYNSEAYFQYCIGTINDDLRDCQMRERLERLLLFKKQFAQLQHRPGFIFQREYPDLNKRLLNWVEAEITYHREINELPYNKQAASDEFSRWANFKVHTRLSVPQISYSLKQLMEAGVYTNQNKTELIEFFAFFFASQKQDSISLKSFRKNFYTDDAAVAENFRGMLIELINHSRKG